LVKTDMALPVIEFGTSLGMDMSKFPAAIESDESADAILKVVGKATRESHSGKFWNYDGSMAAW
jgi:hypothetical protein